MRGFCEYGPVPVEGRCLWCGGPLRVDRGMPGYMGRGYFCTASCGWHFGVRMAELGRRLTTPAEPQDVEP